MSDCEKLRQIINNCNEFTLEKIVRLKHKELLQDILKNKFCISNVLISLFNNIEHYDVDVKTIIEHENSSFVVLKQIVKNNYYLNKYFDLILNNDNCDSNVLTEIIHNTDSQEKIIKILNHKNCNKSVVLHILFYKKCDKAILTKIINIYKKLGDKDEYYDEIIFSLIVENKFYDNEVEKLFNKVLGNFNKCK